MSGGVGASAGEIPSGPPDLLEKRTQVSGLQICVSAKMTSPGWRPRRPHPFGKAWTAGTPSIHKADIKKAALVKAAFFR